MRQNFSSADKTGFSLIRKMPWLAALGALCGLMMFPGAACAQLKITASITVTNRTTNGMVFTLNGDTRTFTNNVANPATMVLTNSDTTGSGTKTNLLNQIQTTPFSQVRSVNRGSNTFDLVGNADLAMALTVAAGYASIGYSTQTVADVIVAQVPVSGLPTAMARTNVASGIAGALNSVENTNIVHQASLAMSELMGKTNAQTISGAKIFTNAAGQFFGILSNSPAISGTVIVLAGGLYTSPIIASPTLTNAVNYGEPFSSQNTNGAHGEQFGQFASATGEASIAIGLLANSPGAFSIAIGSNASATNQSSTSVGTASTALGEASSAYGDIATASGEFSTAIGFSATASALNSTALGFQSASGFVNSTAIGANASTTTSNQVMLGSAGSSVVVPNTLTVGAATTLSGSLTVSGNVSIAGTQANGAFVGTNTYLANADISFTRKAVSSLANGGNAAVPVGTNVFIEVSGPTGAFSIDGIANGRDGKMITVLNQTSLQMTIKNESGTDPTAANRIRTLGSAADLVLTNAACTFIYNANVSRWILISHNP